MTIVDLETVKLEIDSGVARIVLNRPQALNAWTRQLGEDMLSALNKAGGEPEVRAIVFTGEGRAFSSGADLKAGAGELGTNGKPDVRTRLQTVYHPLIRGVRTVPKPVIAAVNGPAVGVGCSLALAADLIVAAESAYFLLAFVNIGLGLDGGASLEKGMLLMVVSSRDFLTMASPTFSSSPNTTTRPALFQMVT